LLGQQSRAKTYSQKVSAGVKSARYSGHVCEVANGNYENISVNDSANNWGECEPYIARLRVVYVPAFIAVLRSGLSHSVGIELAIAETSSPR
jgi:hypothetical protein